jgi:hypothetical protein
MVSGEHLYIAKPFDCKHLVLEGAKNSQMVVAEFGKIYCRKKNDQLVPYLRRLQMTTEARTNYGNTLLHRYLDRTSCNKLCLFMG